MAVFKFSLDAVLRLRQRVEEELQWQLHSLNQSRQATAAAIAQLEQLRRLMDDALGASAGAFLSIIDLQLASESGQRIDQRIKERHSVLRQIDDAIVAKKAELVEAMRAVKSLERLRERQAEKFRREQDAVEQKFVEEVAQRKFVVGDRRKDLPPQ